MGQVNLIPIERRKAARVRRLISYWVAACGFYVVALLAAMAVNGFASADDGRELLGDIERAGADIDTTRAALTTIRSDLDQAEAELRASRAIGRHPDWSVLLAVLTETTEEEIVLRSCRVTAIDALPTTADDATRPAVAGESAETHGAERSPSLEIRGFGRSQQAVTRFVLRLEATGLFTTVTPIDTRREPFLTAEAVAFRIECALDASPIEGEDDA